MRALLVLSILLTESADEDQILRLAGSCAPSLGNWRVIGFAFTGSDWRPSPDSDLDRLPEEVEAELRGLGGVGGALTALPGGWVWAYPLRSVGGRLGYLIAGAQEPPSPDEQFLIQVVAQQTGVAVSNARLHQSERAASEALGAANAALSDNVETLRRGMMIHERLTEVAASGEGAAGIADALHALTGLPVSIEDRYGNLRAWAGPGRPEPYRKPRQDRRDDLLRRLRLEGRSLREGDRVHALASPRPDVLGVVSLIDPDQRSDPADIMALEHGATVLAVELARLRGLADAELRLRRDLLHDLLAGTDNEGAYIRADALGYDLGRPHRVVLLMLSGGRAGEGNEDSFLHAVRRAARELRLPALLGTASGAVIALVAGDADWECLRQTALREHGGGRCRMGVGDLYPRPSDLPRSLREAQLALRLQQEGGVADQASVYAELGVFRMFASLPDLGDVENFATRWLQPLISYDATKRTDLVKTLAQYLEHGGRYESTATALSIHRSTLKYRLQRIRELTGYDLGDPETHFNLQLATRAWTTVGVLGGGTGRGRVGLGPATNSPRDSAGPESGPVVRPARTV